MNLGAYKLYTFDKVEGYLTDLPNLYAWKVLKCRNNTLVKCFSCPVSYPVNELRV